MWFAIIAMGFYALEIAISDLKLSAISPRLLTFYYSLGVAICAFISMILNHDSIVLPVKNSIIFVIIMVITSFIAATAHFYAISSGVGTSKLSLTYAFMPVAGIILMLLFRRELPTLEIVIGCVLAVVALYLVTASDKTTTL